MPTIMLVNDDGDEDPTINARNIAVEHRESGVRSPK